MIILSILVTSFPDSTFNETITRPWCKNQNDHTQNRRDRKFISLQLLSCKGAN
jgi:hypothetical protein